MYYLSPAGALGLAAVYNRMEASGTGRRGQTLGENVNVGITELVLVGQWVFGQGQWMPYAKADIGVFLESISLQGSGGAEGEARFGAGLGPGVQGRLSRTWGLFAEGLMQFPDFSHLSEFYFGVRGGVSIFLGGGDP